jgi:uncharacterized membrane protein YukC
MEELADILERELKGAFQVKDPDSLHRSAQLIAERLVEQQTYDRDHTAVLNELKELSSSMKQGFALMEARFEALQKQMDTRFAAVQKQMDERFGAVQKQMDERFAAQDRRFEDFNSRFEDMNKRFDSMQRLIGVGFTVLAVLIAGFNMFLIFMN